MTTISSIDARYAQDQVGRASMTVKASVSNLVTGKKTDANVADLSVGTVLATRVGTLRVTVGNAGQAKSLLETAKGALDTITDLLQKQKNLAVKAADDSLSNNERAFLNQEFQAIVSEINRIAGNTNFNGKKLLDGSISGVAGTSTTTGIGDEQYSLLKASDITSSGTVASGDLVNSHALAGENKITFSATTAGNAIMTIDSNGTGINGSQTLNFTATTSSITTASAFVTAANASTDSNFQQFSFIDNGDGSVTVRAKEAGTHLNNYTFSLDDDTTGDLNATFGNDGSPDDMEIGTGSARAFTSSQTAATAGAEGVFKTVAANNIADTKFSGAIAFGADSSGSGAATVNGVKRVVTFTLNDQQADAETFTFGGVAFAYDDTPDAVTDIMAGADATETAFNTAAVLNANTTLNVDWVFTSLAGVVTATAKNYGDQTDVAADTYVAGTANITYAVDTAGSNGVAASPTLTIKDASGNTISTTTITIAANVSGNAGWTGDQYTGVQMATMTADYLNNNDNPASRLFEFIDNFDGTISVVAREKNLDINGYQFNFADDILTLASATVGGSTMLGADKSLNVAGTTNTLATAKSIAVTDLTLDPNLLGGLENLQATFGYNVDNSGNNTVQFQVEVNGTQYTSQVIYLQGDSTTATESDTIKAGTKLIFQSSSGPVDSNGAYTNNGFQLTIGTSDVTLASVSSSAAGQESLDDIVTDWQTQLTSVSIAQERSLNLAEISPSSSDHRITAAVGTVLEGLRGFDSIGSNKLSYNSGDIRLISDQYGDIGSHGSITSFTVDRLTDTITTTINGEVYTAYLNSASVPSIGNIEAFGSNADGTSNNGTYDATTKIISLGSSSGSTAKLNFYSANTEDGRILTVDLGHVADNISQINISTKEGEDGLANALNAVFNVSSNDSLTFQVGAEATDTIGVSIGSALTTDIYTDDEGVTQTLSVATSADAIAASDVLDNAIRNVITLISNVSAAITAFDSSIQNNQASIQNADAARSKLLDTDYTAESTRFAESRVRVDAATAVLAQVNTRIQNLLQLLRQ